MEGTSKSDVNPIDHVDVPGIGLEADDKSCLLSAVVWTEEIIADTTGDAEDDDTCPVGECAVGKILCEVLCFLVWPVDCADRVGEEETCLVDVVVTFVAVVGYGNVELEPSMAAFVSGSRGTVEYEGCVSVVVIMIFLQKSSVI